MYEKIKRYYERGLWSKAMVKAVVGKVITEGEYKKITNEKY